MITRHHSSIASAEDAGWALAVRSKRGRSRRRVFSAKTVLKCGTNLSWYQSDAFTENDNGTSERDQAAVADLTFRIERYTLKMPQIFLDTIFCCLKRILRNCPLALVRSFGIGPIGTGICSAYQLVLLEAIRQRFGVPMVSFQDPVTTLCEQSYLERRGITVLPSDDLLSEPTVDVSPTEFTMLYMIHCTAKMYNNVLSYYSRADQLQNLILIGNARFSQANGAKMFFAAAKNARKKIRPWDPNASLSSVDDSSVSNSVPLPHLAAFARQSISYPLPSFEPSNIAFNSTYISFLAVDTDFQE